jgi:B9 domain-containing protein 2
MSQTAEAYFIGRVHSCSGFKAGAFCRWWVCVGPQWKLISGVDRGQTQTDSPSDSSGICIWSHPLDLYYEFTGIQGWPKLSFEVWEHDSLGRSFLGGYGFCPLPMSPGIHKIDVHLWRPVGSFVEDLSANFIGGSPHLRNDNIVAQPNDRFRLRSESSGDVHVDISLILGRATNFHVAF